MITDRYEIEIAGITVEVVRKDIKHLHVGVYPPSGRVRVAAPLRLGGEAVQLAVLSRLGWIQRKQKEFAGQHRQSQRELVTGESHYYQGGRYLLEVKESDSRPGVRLIGPRRLQLCVHPGADRDQRDAVLQLWYRRELRKLLEPLLAKWVPKVGAPATQVRIKRMKTRWGSCNSDAGRIWLNLELIKKPAACLEYVLVHELVHLHERRHNDRFQDWMERLMPNWPLFRAELNQAPLAHEEWQY